MNRYSRIFHHITTEDVKRKRRENIKVQEIKDELERERLEAIVEPVQHIDWRDDLKELAGFEWVRTPNGPTNSASTKFTGQYHGVNTANTFTANGLGGSDVLPTSITVNVEGESVSVDPPTYSQFPIAGLPMPVSAAIWRQQNEQKAKDINKRLDASEQFAKKVNADALMQARVDEFQEKVDKINAYNDTVRIRNWEKVTDYVKSLKLKGITARDLQKKGVIKIKGGAVGMKDDGKGNIKIRVFKGPDIYIKGTNIYYLGQDYTTEGEDFNTEEGVAPVPAIPADLQKWLDAQNVGNKLQSKIKQFDRQTFNQIKADLNPFRPIDTITKSARIWASKQISKALMWTVKNFKGSMETPAAVMLAYNDFALNKATGEGSTTSNRLELNNLVSQSDNALIKNNLSGGMTIALSKYQQDPVKFKGLLESAAQTAFQTVVKNNPQFRATFGGAAGSFPQVRIVGNNLVFEKSYGFQHGGSAENIPIQTRLAMDVLGLPPDTTGGSLLSPAPIAAKIGLQGDDIHARYYNTMTREERGGKQTSVVHSLYNVPDMHYKYTVPISELLKSKLEPTKPQPKAPKKVEKKKEGRLSAYGGDQPIVRDKKKTKKRVVATESRALSKIKNQFSYKGKPSPDGFPDAPPPKLKNGYHPGYGKRDNMYNRLDSISAKSMPKTGDPTIDKKVEKAKKQKKGLTNA